MKIWIDAQLAPALAAWITKTLGVSASAVRDLGLRDGLRESLSSRSRVLQPSDRDG